MPFHKRWERRSLLAPLQQIRVVGLMLCWLSSHVPPWFLGRLVTVCPDSCVFSVHFFFVTRSFCHKGGVSCKPEPITCWLLFLVCKWCQKPGVCKEATPVVKVAAKRSGLFTNGTNLHGHTHIHTHTHAWTQFMDGTKLHVLEGCAQDMLLVPP